MNRIACGDACCDCPVRMRHRGVCSDDHTAPAFSADDESAVRALVNEFANTWNRHDMKAMHELDTDDVEWINVVGHHWRGKLSCTRATTRFTGPWLRRPSMSVESAIVRSIAPNVAIAVATMHFGASLDPRWPTVPAAKTSGSFTMVKRDDSWKIAHFQNTIIDSKAEHNDLINWDEASLLPPR